MTSFGLLIICLQAFLVQNAISQYLGPARYDALPPGVRAPTGAGCRSLYGLGADVFTPGIAGYPVATAYDLGAEIITPAYGGTGVGDVAVAGEMPVAGSTFVAGQVPVIGAVHFVGELPAAGIVSVIGNCDCGCGASMFY